MVAIMADVFSKAKLAEVMSHIRGPAAKGEAIPRFATENEFLYPHATDTRLANEVTVR